MISRQRMTYARAGVSIAAGEELVRRIGPIAKRTTLPGVLAGVGGFSALFDLKTRRYRSPVLVSSTDGVGTKLKVAFMTGVHDTVGIDLVAMGVNDILTQGAEPLFFLDYFVCGRLDVDVAEAVVRGIAEGCRQAGCALIGGETAEHPGDFPKGEYDLAGFAVGVLEKKRILDPKAIVAGDVLIGLPSSGLHSNGYSLARKVLLEMGGMKLHRRNAELGRTLGEELLAPTRIYAKIIRFMFARGLIKGAAHITGGGIPGNLIRILPEGCEAVVDSRGWVVPPLFRLLQEGGGIGDSEMREVFNLGIGMIAVLPRGAVEPVRLAAGAAGVETWVIGEVRRGERSVRFG